MFSQSHSQYNQSGQSGGGSQSQVPFSKTKLLKVDADGIYGLDNNTIVDESDSAFTVTRFGETSNSQFSPFNSGGWSYQFDSADHLALSANNSQFNPESGDFCVQFSICPTNWSSNGCGIIGQKANDSSKGWVIYNNTTWPNKLTIRVGGSGTTYDFVSASDVVNGVWSHWAFVIESGVAKLYKDGVLDTTKALVLPITDSAGKLTIGHTETWSGNAKFRGKMYNLRVVKGSAVITGNYTPSLEPLTAIPGTVLLTCQSSRIIDLSVNNFTFTKTGFPACVNNTPRTKDVYNQSVHGGSYVFDGNGDYFKLNDLPGLRNLATGDFTIEFWFYPTKPATLQQLIYFVGDSTGYAEFSLQLDASNNLVLRRLNGSAYNWLTTTVPFTGFNEWNHISINKSGNGVKVFLNFKQLFIENNIGNQNLAFTTTSIGSYNNTFYYFNGYIGMLRVEKGFTRYTVDQLPASEPPVKTPYTTLLLTGNKSNIVDSTGNFTLTTGGNARVASEKKLNDKNTIYFDGTGDYIRVCPIRSGAIDSVPIIPAKGDFELKASFWLLTGANNRVIFSNKPATADNTGGFYFGLNAAGNLVFVFNTTSYVTNLICKFNKWYTVCISRKSNQISIYLNDSKIHSMTDSTVYLSATLTIGSHADGSQAWHGYIANFSAETGGITYNDAIIVPATISDNKVSVTNPGYLDEVFSLGLNNSQYDKNYGNPVVDLVDDTYPKTLQLNNIFDSSMSPYSRGGFSHYYSAGSRSEFPLAANFNFYGKKTTIEAWINVKVITTALYAIIQNLEAAGSLSQLCFTIRGIANTNDFNLGFYSCKTNTSVFSTIRGSINEWVHVAVELDLTAGASAAAPLTFFINGTKEVTSIDYGTITDVSPVSTSVLAIGKSYSGVTAFEGQIFALRIVQSADSVYSADFTPAKAKLEAIPGTHILTCQDPYLLDAGPNKFKMVIAYPASGISQIIPYSPVPITEDQDFAVQGASLYMKTIDVNLLAPLIQGTKSWAFGTGDFTIHMGVMWPEVTAATETLLYLTCPDGNYLKIARTNTNIVLYWRTMDRGVAFKFMQAMWYDIMIVRKANTLNCYINGKLIQTYLENVNWSFNGYRIGQALANAEVCNANITHVHIASKAIKDGEFIPSMADRAQIPESVIYYNFNRPPVIYDKTCNYTLIPKTKTLGNTALPKINSANPNSLDPLCLEFVKTAEQRMLFSLNRSILFLNHDFNIEFMYKRSVNVASSIIFAMEENTSNFTSVVLEDNSGTLRLWSSTNGTTSWDFGAGTSVGTIPLGTWTHINLRRVNGTLSVYVNGSFTYALPVTQANLSGNVWGVRDQGMSMSGRAVSINGFISQLKINYGKAKYIRNDITS